MRFYYEEGTYIHLSIHPFPLRLNVYFILSVSQAREGLSIEIHFPTVANISTIGKQWIKNSI